MASSTGITSEPGTSACVYVPVTSPKLQRKRKLVHVNDIHTDVLLIEKEKIKLEMEYIQLKIKKSYFRNGTIRNEKEFSVNTLFLTLSTNRIVNYSDEFILKLFKFIVEKGNGGHIIINLNEII